MYFRNILCSVAFATLASAAVAKQIPTPYASDSHEDGSEEILERDAEAEAVRKAAWEEAHGGEAPSYHFGEAHDPSAWHVARDAEPMAEADRPTGWASWLGGYAKPRNKHLKPYHHEETADIKARDVDDAEGDEDFDDEDFANLEARDVSDDEVPDFGDEEVDTSLEGYGEGEGLEARDVEDEDFEEDDEPEGLESRDADGGAGDADYSLDGYDFDESEEDFEKRDVDEEYEEVDEEDFSNIQARDVKDDEIPDFGDEEADTSLEGYDEPADLEARSVGDEGQSESESDQVPDFGGEEVDTSLEGYDADLEERDVEDDDVTEDLDDETNNADAAYENEPVAEELVAEEPEAPQLQ